MDDGLITLVGKIRKQFHRYLTQRISFYERVLVLFLHEFAFSDKLYTNYMISWAEPNYILSWTNHLMTHRSWNFPRWSISNSAAEFICWLLFGTSDYHWQQNLKCSILTNFPILRKSWNPKQWICYVPKARSSRPPHLDLFGIWLFSLLLIGRDVSPLLWKPLYNYNDSVIGFRLQRMLSYNW